MRVSALCQYQMHDQCSKCDCECHVVRLREVNRVVANIKAIVTVSETMTDEARVQERWVSEMRTALRASERILKSL